MQKLRSRDIHEQTTTLECWKGGVALSISTYTSLIVPQRNSSAMILAFKKI